jgi:hypothetical protein
MRLKFTAFILPLILLSGCKKDSKPAIIEVTVHLQNQTILSNVKVNLLTVSSGTITATLTGASDGNGKIDYNVSAGKSYYLYYDGTNQETIYNTEATYITKGKFTSQQQINGSPYQGLNTKVGDDIYMDINGDGAINDYDKILAVTEPSGGGTTSVNLTLFTNNLL